MRERDSVRERAIGRERQRERERERERLCVRLIVREKARLCVCERERLDLFLVPAVALLTA